jgi:heme/copper-type cytochrome/quinol oxidase subunit 2
MKKQKIRMAVTVVAIIVVAICFGVGAWLYAHAPAYPSAQNAPIGTKTDLGTVAETGIQAAPGTSVVSSAGVVVTKNGQVAQNNVSPGTPLAPQESSAVNAVTLPNQSVKIAITMKGGWSPNSFTVKANAPVTIGVTSGDAFTHVFAFRDPSLLAVAVGVGSYETRAITFNAPSMPGNYTFYSNVPGQTGFTGVMTVQ